MSDLAARISKLAAETGLTAREEQLLLIVAAAPGYVSLRKIGDQIYGAQIVADRENVLRVFMHNIRRKLARKRIVIQTAWSRGYYLPDESRAVIDCIRIQEAA